MDYNVKRIEQPCWKCAILDFIIIIIIIIIIIYNEAQGDTMFTSCKNRFGPAAQERHRSQ